MCNIHEVDIELLITHFPAFRLRKSNSASFVWIKDSSRQRRFRDIQIILFKFFSPFVEFPDNEYSYHVRRDKENGFRFVLLQHPLMSMTLSTDSDVDLVP